MNTLEVFDFHALQKTKWYYFYKSTTHTKVLQINDDLKLTWRCRAVKVMGYRLKPLSIPFEWFLKTTWYLQTDFSKTQDNLVLLLN